MPSIELTHRISHASTHLLGWLPANRFTHSAISARLPRLAMLVGALFCLLAEQSLAQLPVTSLRSLSQSCFSPGEEVEIGIAEGTQTEEVAELIVSHPGIRSELLPGTAKPYSNQPNPRYGKFRLRVADDVPTGRYEIRAWGRFGVSNPRAILVVDQNQAVAGSPHSEESAYPITNGVLYHRHASAATRDYYTLPVVAEKTYGIQLIGHSIDSRLIGVLSVVDSKGRTILSRIGSDQTDLEFSFVAESSETLTVIIHDAMFRGGASYHYGLRVSEGNAPADFEPAMLPKAITAHQVPDKTLPNIDVENNNSAILQVPFRINATFADDGDRKHYLCRLSKDKPVRIDVASDRYGEPTDVRLIVEQAAGTGEAKTWQRVATSEDSFNISDSVMRLGTADPSLDYRPPADGEYRITLIDLDSGNSLSASQRFSLAASEPKPDWQLLAYRLYPHRDVSVSRPAGTQLLRGGGVILRVFAIRRNFAQPIRVSVPDLPQGVSCRPAWIAPNQNQVDLVITAAPDAKAGIMSCRVVGEIAGKNPVDRRQADYATVTWEQDGYRPFVMTRVTDNIVLEISDRDSSPLSMRVETEDPVIAKAGGKITLPIKLRRTEGGKQNVVLRARNLPPGVTAGDLTIPGDKSEAQWTINISDKATPGKYSLWGQGETQVKYALNPQASTHLTGYLEKLKTARGDPKNAEKTSEIDKLIAETQKQLETIKKQIAPRDFTVFIPTPLITLEIP